MKKIFDLLRKPFVKIVGVSIVLYFGLFYRNDSYDSLSKRLAPDHVKQNFNEVQEKSKFILTSLNSARQAAYGKSDSHFDDTQNFAEISIKDVEFGKGENFLQCGFEAEISYDLRIKDSISAIESITGEKILIGSNLNLLFEKKLLGMKVGGTRIINIPRNFKSTNQKLAFTLKFNEADLQYYVTLSNLRDMREETKNTINCQNNEDDNK